VIGYHVIIVGVFWSAFRWPIGILEAIAAIAVILALGAALAVGAFWVLYRTLSQFGSASLETESDESEIDDASFENWSAAISDPASNRDEDRR
jgi:uncharacterized membrane protein YqjE